MLLLSPYTIDVKKSPPRLSSAIGDQTDWIGLSRVIGGTVGLHDTFYVEH